MAQADGVSHTVVRKTGIPASPPAKSLSPNTNANYSRTKENKYIPAEAIVRVISCPKDNLMRFILQHIGIAHVFKTANNRISGSSTKKSKSNTFVSYELNIWLENIPGSNRFLSPSSSCSSRPEDGFPWSDESKN